MTSPAEPASADGTPASQLTRPLREPAALVLLGANAVFLFVGLIRLLTPTGYGTATGRAGNVFFMFAGVEAVALPVLAVLLATHLRPVAPRAKLITQVALGEYAASAVLGGLTFLIWTVGRLAEGEVLDAFLGLLARLAWLAVLAVAAYAVYRIWRTLYHVPKPQPQPGVYGRPQPGWPQPGHPTQGGWSAPGQPGASPVPGQPTGWSAPTQYGTPYGQQTPPFTGSPQAGPQSAPPFPPAPQSTPPAHPAPPPGQPQPAPPFAQPPSADPTQTIPRQPSDSTQALPPDSETDRTQRLNPNDNPDQPH